MGKDTKIDWADHSFNPWRGCTAVSAGCDHCYADRQAKRNPKVLGVWGVDGVRVVAKDWYSQVRSWNREAGETGKPALVFPSMCDPFEEFGGEIRDHLGNGLFIHGRDPSYWVRNNMPEKPRGDFRRVVDHAIRRAFESEQVALD